MQWNKTKRFKVLEKRWYAKLTKRGFEDVEHDEKNLKQFSGTTSTHRADGSSKIEDWAEWGKSISIADHWKTEYYSRCRQFLNEFKFKNKTEKKIFEMHSEGIGRRVIAVAVKSYSRKVDSIIHKLVKEMKKSG